MKKLLAAALFAALFSGCSSIKICDVGGHTIAVVENSGWYLFDCIPLASGNPDNPNGHMCRFFTNTVTLENNMKLLDEAPILNETHFPGDFTTNAVNVVKRETLPPNNLCACDSQSQGSGVVDVQYGLRDWHPSRTAVILWRSRQRLRTPMAHQSDT